MVGGHLCARRTLCSGRSVYIKRPTHCHCYYRWVSPLLLCVVCSSRTCVMSWRLVSNALGLGLKGQDRPHAWGKAAKMAHYMIVQFGSSTCCRKMHPAPVQSVLRDETVCKSL